MTSTGAGSGQPFPVMADALRVATENAADLWRAGADALAAQAEAVRRHPPPFPVPGLEQYLDLLRQATDANRELADRWVAAVRTMTAMLVPDAAGDAGDHRRAAEPVPVEPASEPAEPAPAQTEPAPEPLRAELEPAPAPTETAARPRTRRPTTRKRSAASTAAGADPDDPRTAYLGMGKAALSARLAARGLPKSGTLAQLADRLVAADAADRSTD